MAEMTRHTTSTETRPESVKEGLLKEP